MHIKRNRQKGVLKAVLTGAISGLIGVAILLVILQRNTLPALPIQVDSQQAQGMELTAVLYASQHGVYSDEIAAQQFVQLNSPIQLAAIIKIEEKYYVWSSITASAEKLQLMESPKRFSKSFQLNSESCQKPLKQLSEFISNESYFLEDIENPKLLEDWLALINSLKNMNEQITIVRVHALNHYMQQNECVKIVFPT